MLWSFEKRYYLTTLKQELSTAKHMGITGLMRRLSLVGIDAIWQLSLDCLLMRTIESFLRYTDNLNFINGCYDIKPVRKKEGKSYWKIPLCNDDATMEK